MATADPLPPLPLRLRPSAPPTDAATAWLLPGGDAAAWLNEIARWEVPLAEVRLMPVPVSPSDRTAAAVVAFVDSPPRSRPAGHALPYRLLASGIYAPIGAALSPPMSAEELSRHIVWPYAVFHPGLGLIGCGREDLLRASDLIDVAAPQATEWPPAVRDRGSNRRIESIHPIFDPAAPDILELLRDDVGSATPDELPPLPEESTGRRLIDRARQGVARAIGGIAGGLSEHSDAFRALAGWAKERADALAAGLNAARARELARLMNLLESDPDEGLKYALPLQGDARRGTAAPGGRLAARTPSFSLGSLFSSAAGDAWDIRADTEAKLRRRYRELAARELGLRRYGRAAYIFANLLGDYGSAANALEQGQQWREAAALYQDKLHDRKRAAACLEKGGLIHEAIAVYLTLGQHTKTGDLYALIGCPEEAAAAYRTAVRSHLAQDDALAAARVLEAKLGAADEALTVLTDAWPGSRQAVPCACEAFALLARLDRHGEALRRIDLLRSSASTASLRHQSAEVAAEVAATYPAGPVRVAAEDATRFLVGHALAEATRGRAEALLALVTRAADGDRLLARDTAAFLSVFTPHTSARPADRKPADQTPKLIRTITLPPTKQWSSLLPTHNGYVALGFDHDNLALARGTWDGPPQTVTFHRPGASGEPLRMVVAGNQIRLYRMLAPIDFVGFYVYFPPHGSLPEMPITNAEPKQTGFTLGVAASTDGHLHWIGRTDEDVSCPLVHKVFDADGRLIDTEETDIAVPGDTPLGSIHFLAQQDAQVLTAGSSLCFLRKGRPTSVVRLPGEALRMTGDLSAHAAVRVTVDFHDGAAVVWPLSNAVERFARDLSSPVSHVLPDGSLIAVDDHAAQVFRLDERRPSRRSSFRPPSGVVGVTKTDLPRQFALLCGDGSLHVHQLDG